MGPCSENFGGVYSNIDIFFNMANCLGLARGSSAPGVPGTNASLPANAVSNGAEPINRTQRGLLAGMMVFQLCIGWAIVNM